MRVTRNRYGGVSMRGVVPGALLNASLPPLVADWSGPSMTMDAGTWTTELVSPFSFTDPTFNDGFVQAIIDDGSGGKFVAGTFTSVTCNVTSTTYTTGYTRLIHLLPTGEVDAAWSCPVGTTYPWALALDAANDRLYVGGGFSSIGGVSKTDLAVVTASTGVVVSGWTCNVVGYVNALALDIANDRLYVGGAYTSIGGVTRADLAAVTASTGVVDAGWSCDSNNAIWSLALDTASDSLYIGGVYTSIGGESKVGLARATASTGVVDAAWTCNTSAGSVVYAMDVDVVRDTLYVGGLFTSLGGLSRSRLAAVTASTGATISGWVCDTGTGITWVVKADLANDVLYVGGSWSSIESTSKLRLAAVTASTGDLVSAWTCDANNQVRALQLDVSNDALFVGGFFSGATGLDGQQRDRFGTVVASTGDLFVP